MAALYKRNESNSDFKNCKVVSPRSIVGRVYKSISYIKYFAERPGGKTKERYRRGGFADQNVTLRQGIEEVIKKMPLTFFKKK